MMQYTVKTSLLCTPTHGDKRELKPGLIAVLVA
jgi:hypothetical protein